VKYERSRLSTYRKHLDGHRLRPNYPRNSPSSHHRHRYQHRRKWQRNRLLFTKYSKLDQHASHRNDNMRYRICFPFQSKSRIESQDHNSKISTNPTVIPSFFSVVCAWTATNSTRVRACPGPTRSNASNG